MKIERLAVGQLQTNCYLAWGGEGRETLIIDPGDDGDYIIRKIQDFGLEPKLIVATHGHVDHVLAVTELKLAFKIPFLMHRADLPILKRTEKTAEYFMGFRADPPPPVDKFIKEGDLIKFGKERLEVIETPGHSPGGICLYSRTEHLRGGVAPAAHLGGESHGILFSGDTLFHQGVGRTDFSYASAAELKKSIKKLLKLSGGTLVYPGHGPETTIDEARKYLAQVQNYF